MAAGGGGNKHTASPSSASAKKPKTKKPHSANHHQNLTQLIPLLASTTAAAHSFLSHHDLLLHPSQSLSIESHLSSTYLSLSRLLSLLSLPPPTSLPFSSPPPPSPHCWFHRFLSVASTDYDPRWTDSFRMSKPSFTLLLRLLSPSLTSLFPLPPNYALAATLFRLSHAASYKSVGRRFGLDSPTTCRAFYTVCKAINDNLGHLFELGSDINRIVVGFGWISLPNCCGALGIEKFEIDGDLIGKNGSLMVQALVDSELRFLDVSAGWPSTMKPSTILRQSKLFSSIEESKELLNGQSFDLSDGSSIPQYILGDSCFPLLPWLLTPIRNSDHENCSLSFPERAFNSVHSHGMELVKTAFGRVRRRWELLSKSWKEGCIESFPFVIMTGCLLHNFLIKCSEDLDNENVKYSKNSEVPVFEEEEEEDEDGKRIRYALALHLTRVSQRR